MVPPIIALDSDLFRSQSPDMSLAGFISPTFSQRQGQFKPFGASDGEAEYGSCDAHDVRVGVLRCDKFKDLLMNRRGARLSAGGTPITGSRTLGRSRHLARGRDRFPLEAVGISLGLGIIELVISAAKANRMRGEEELILCCHVV